MRKSEGNTEEISRFDLRLPASLLDAVERIAEDEHRTTSAQIRLALTQHVRNYERSAA